MEMTQVRRVRGVFAGRVQGVFFRATAAELAREAGVRGFVRNEPDGTVYLEAEADADALERFLAALRERYAGFITDEKVSPVAGLGGEPGFEIRR
jgi:acylphosphatase